MPVEQVKEFLESNDVKYVTISHSPAYTAQELAAEAGIPGREVAKTVMVKIDGRLAMAVLPAPYLVDVEAMTEATGSDAVQIATEDEFKDRFAGCELGAMPPFGNLWDMRVFVDRRLREDEKIAFNAGTHSELIQMAYAEFERLVEPVVLEIGVHEEAA